MNTHRPDVCPDAETLGAWSEKGLPPAEMRAVDAHVAGCPRCLAQAAALARSAPIAERAPARAHGWFSWTWLVPAAAGMAALGLWIAVQPRTTSLNQMQRPEPPSATTAAPEPVETRQRPERSTSAAREATPPPAQRQSATAGDAAPRPEQKSETTSADARVDMEKDAPPARVPAQAANENAPAAPPATPPAAAPPAAASPATAAGARMMLRMTDAIGPATEIISTDRSVRWRIQGIAIERTTDGGATWTRQTSSAAAPLTAGAAPSADVCWIVGRRGTVLRTIDGGAVWQPTASPDAADLTQVTATGRSAATVTTSDARRFTTEDGGATWRSGGLQDF